MINRPLEDSAEATDDGTKEEHISSNWRVLEQKELSGDDPYLKSFGKANPINVYKKIAQTEQISAPVESHRSVIQSQKHPTTLMQSDTHLSKN